MVKMDYQIDWCMICHFLWLPNLDMRIMEIHTSVFFKNSIVLAHCIRAICHYGRWVVLLCMCFYRVVECKSSEEIELYLMETSKRRTSLIPRISELGMWVSFSLKAFRSIFEYGDDWTHRNIYHNNIK